MALCWTCCHNISCACSRLYLKQAHHHSSCECSHISPPIQPTVLRYRVCHPVPIPVRQTRVRCSVTWFLLCTASGSLGEGLRAVLKSPASRLGARDSRPNSIRTVSRLGARDSRLVLFFAPSLAGGRGLEAGSVFRPIVSERVESLRWGLP
jgi:hypothetical protein